MKSSRFLSEKLISNIRTGIHIAVFIYPAKRRDIDVFDGIVLRFYCEGKLRRLLRHRSIVQSNRKIGNRFDNGRLRLRDHRSVVKKESNNFFSSRKRNLRVKNHISLRNTKAGVYQNTFLSDQRSRSCVILLNQKHAVFGNFSAYRQCHTGVCIPDLSVKGNLRRSDNRHGIIRLVEAGLVIISFWKINIRILVPVSHGAHAIACLQRCIRERNLQTGNSLRNGLDPKKRNLAATLEIKGIALGVLGYTDIDLCLSLSGRLEKALVASQRNVKRGRALLQLFFIDGSIRINVILETLAVFIHNLQRLGKGRTVVILAHRHIQAGDDIVAYRKGQLGFRKGKGSFKAICYPAGPENFIKIGIRIKACISCIAADFQPAFIHGIVQFYADVHRSFLLCELLCTRFSVFHQGHAGIFQNLLRRFLLTGIGLCLLFCNKDRG